ncbi:SGNH/GDSL hydrolase family protein [Mycolicibacterium phlei]|uniref:SGNH/GDSL hydrolase family protein n=1 Tax=Mycolicibacterium phlei TaxID=1771 RepID=UPI0037CB6BA1
MSRYVALGSSMAAGPGIRPRAQGSPMAAGRSARNYPHLVAQRLGLDLVDVTFSGATTAHVLSESQSGVPPQISALDGTERLVTITIGGNDVGYVPMLLAAGLPRVVRSVPVLGAAIRGQVDRTARSAALEQVGTALEAVGTAVRERSPRASVLFVDYLTLLPPEGTPAPPLSDIDAATGRFVAAELQRRTAEAAAVTGAGLVCAAEASRDHHAWSADPWTTRFGVPVPWRPAPLHPNATGMRAVADLVVATVS